MERAEEGVWSDEFLEVDILSFSHLYFDLLCLFELGGLEEVSTLLEQTMHLLVAECELQIRNPALIVSKTALL